MTQIQLALAMIALRYRVRLEPGHQGEAVPRFTLQPKGGMQVTLKTT